MMTADRSPWIAFSSDPEPAGVDTGSTKAVQALPDQEERTSLFGTVTQYLTDE